MTESPWGRPYNKPFELDTPVEAWRIDPIEAYNGVAYLRSVPNFLGPWSQRAVCQKMGAFHLRPPVSRCSCGYRVVNTLEVLAEYWECHKGLWFPDAPPAVIRVLAAGRAQTYDQEHNLDRTNCLSVEYLRLAPGSTIYTPAAEHADVLRWRYPNNRITVTDGVDFAAIIETEAEPSRPLSAAGGQG